MSWARVTSTVKNSTRDLLFYCSRRNFDVYEDSFDADSAITLQCLKASRGSGDDEHHSALLWRVFSCIIVLRSSNCRNPRSVEVHEISLNVADAVFVAFACPSP